MKTFIVILVLAVIAVGGYMLLGREEVREPVDDTNLETQSVATSTPSVSTSTPKNATSTTATTTKQNGSSGIAASFTLAQVATHNNSKDCWSAVNGSVYNLTSWVAKHPGGQQAILSICGKDGTQAFESQHEGDRKPQNILAGYFVGTLK